MKKLLSIFLVQLVCSNVYSQKNYTLGVDWIYRTSHAKNTTILKNFSNANGIQLTYRKNTNHNNFFTLKLNAVESSKNIFTLQSLRLGYEVENRKFIKNLFVTTEIVFNRFNSNNLSSNSYSFAPSLGLAYNLKLNKYFLLRANESIEFHLPTNFGTFFSNFSFGLHYNFNREKMVKSKDN